MLGVTLMCCFSRAGGLEVCPVLPRRETKTCIPHSHGEPGWGVCPPSWRPWASRHPWGWVSLSAAQLSPQPDSPRSMAHRGCRHTFRWRAAHTGAPGSPGRSRQHRTGVSAALARSLEHSAHLKDCLKHLLLKEKEMEPTVSSSNFHTVQDR